MNVIDKINIYSGLPREIYVLFLVRIVNAMGNFVYPFLTFFLTDRIGMSPKAAGAFFLVSTVMQGLGSIIGGKLADHFGRKKLLVTFMSLSALSFLPCPFLGNSIMVPFFIILSGTFAGAAQPTTSAILTDLTNPDNRKQAFSLLYMGVNIGFAIGPMIAGFLYKNYTSWIFFGNIFALTISSLLIIMFISETLPHNHTEEYIENTNETAENGGVLRALLKKPVLILFSMSRLVYQFVYSCIGFAIPLQMTAVYGSNLGPKNFGIIMSFTGIVIIVSTIPITKFTSDLKPLINVAMAGFFYAVGFGMIGIIHTMPLYLLSAFIFTVGEILEATNSGVYIANHSPVTHRGRFSAILNFFTSSGFAVGPFFFGKFISAFGLPKLWLLCFVLTSCAALFMVWTRFFEIRHSEKITNSTNC